MIAAKQIRIHVHSEPTVHDQLSLIPRPATLKSTPFGLSMATVDCPHTIYERRGVRGWFWVKIGNRAHRGLYGGICPGGPW